jgi:hypothetical protein
MEMGIDLEGEEPGEDSKCMVYEWCSDVNVLLIIQGSAEQPCVYILRSGAH